jgi:hypothetical protein
MRKENISLKKKQKKNQIKKEKIDKKIPTIEMSKGGKQQGGKV